MPDKQFYVHPTAIVDEAVSIGSGTKIWHFCHVMKGARLGRGCSLGQNVFVANDVIIGNNVKIQNNVSIYSGVELEDDVFCGPSCVFTNISNPRSQIVRRDMYERTLVRRGATIGANATVVCGREIGRYAFIGAGATVTSSVPDYALMLGLPARQVGWMSRHGHRLPSVEMGKVMVCPQSQWRYQEVEKGLLRCIDWPEDKPLGE
jgi:UDP-2-acetamido-3-amino-2,3-dideoxy-glucuronate N-acetyltransferase